MTEQQQPLVVRLLGVVTGGPAAVAREVQGLPARLADARTKVEQQVRVAHWIGEMAVTVGTREVGKRVAGLRSSSAASGPGTSSTAGSTKRSAEVSKPPFVGYDDLAAPEVVSLVVGLPHADLGIIRDYEAANRGRRTILNRIDLILGADE